MRINQWLASNTALSRRKADDVIALGRVKVDGEILRVGQAVENIDSHIIELDGTVVHAKNNETITLILHKPLGYVCSKDGQGNQTIYDLLPSKYHSLNNAGRLDKDSTGLILLTNDGDLAYKLTHPRFNKSKKYEIVLDKPLNEKDQTTIKEGVTLEDGKSALDLKKLEHEKRRLADRFWQVSMHEGRNRQIRRTFEHLGYRVVSLHRTEFGEYKLGKLDSGKFSIL